MRRYVPQQAEFRIHSAHIPKMLIVQEIDTDTKSPYKVGRKTEVRVKIRIAMLHVGIKELRVGP